MTASALIEIVPGPRHEIDEHVFERWRRALPNKTGAIAIRRDGRFQRLGVAARDMQAVAERRHHFDAGTAGKLSRKPRESFTLGAVDGEGREL
jgi:hypothetical protein